MKKIKFNINLNHKDILLHLLIYCGIIFIIVLVGMLPYYIKISNQVKENEKLKVQIKEQKELKPVYQTVINANEDKNEFALPHPEKMSLPRSEAQKFQTDFQNAAKKTGLNEVSFTPDINTSASPSTSLLHNIVMKGEFSNLRKFLIELGAIPYVDRIEEINIQQGVPLMEFKMKVWIAIK